MNTWLKSNAITLIVFFFTLGGTVTLYETRLRAVESDNKELQEKMSVYEKQAIENSVKLDLLLSHWNIPIPK